MIKSFKAETTPALSSKPSNCHKIQMIALSGETRGVACLKTFRIIVSLTYLAACL